ncbi:MAG: hypothetical protein SCK70_09670 [bacterium]|nr:hypothetical protein [bacterium]
MLQKRLFIALVLLTSVSLLLFCEKKEKLETGEIAPQPEVQPFDSVTTIKPAPLNYDSLYQMISAITDSLLQNPTDIALRRQLVSAGYDTLWETIFAVGFGKSSDKATTGAVDQKFIEQAATADAYRWAAYIKFWHQDASDPEFGSISTNISGGRIVTKKILSDNRMAVMIEVKADQISK